MSTSYKADSIEVLEGLDLVRDGPECAGHRTALHEDVRPEARESAHPEGQVELVVLLELVLLRVGEDRVAELLRLRRGQGRQLQGVQAAVDAELRRRIGGDVEVARPLLDHRLQELMQVRHAR